MPALPLSLGAGTPDAHRLARIAGSPRAAEARQRRGQLIEMGRHPAGGELGAQRGSHARTVGVSPSAGGRGQSASGGGLGLRDGKSANCA
ncbi:hypothetical protein ACNTMW_29535 [Planosporangium sp. 12N6]|uniref:hypothetical protein n=1 Tax=Planosporangium spinosum TaxID=3402278 RepID=UPI003CF1EB00